MNHVCHGCTEKDTYVEQQFVVNPGSIGYPSDRWVCRCRKESTCEKFQRAMERRYDMVDSWTYAEKVSKELDKEKDNVNHPSHYADVCSLECIDVMEAVFGPEVVFDYAIVNAFKYLWRYKNKNGQEDIRKAEWYLDKAHDLDNKEDLVGSRRDKYLAVRELYFKVRDKERGKEDGEVQ